MLSAILPQRIGSRVQIPGRNYALARAVEAYSFFPDHDDGRTLTLRRIAGDKALIAARQERSQHTPAFVAQVRAVLRVWPH
jgi:hypothetical protein